MIIMLTIIAMKLHLFRPVINIKRCEFLIFSFEKFPKSIKLDYGHISCVPPPSLYHVPPPLLYVGMVHSIQAKQTFAIKLQNINKIFYFKMRNHIYNPGFPSLPHSHILSRTVTGFLHIWRGHLQHGTASACLLDRFKMRKHLYNLHISLPVPSDLQHDFDLFFSY